MLRQEWIWIEEYSEKGYRYRILQYEAVVVGREMKDSSLGPQPVYILGDLSSVGRDPRRKHLQIYLHCVRDVKLRQHGADKQTELLIRITIAAGKLLGVTADHNKNLGFSED
jgi:hypothetical protein